ncbi:MAG: helix-turn-helix domain-containing protein [Leptospiraceae bacterium]|nr:helix-turn-helix domain-containing protein [Leptospiraceae bacterium]
MAANILPYFKFVSALIDSGIWADLSPAARALYPVLLRFSDRDFKPVYPGSQVLLKLTGFKQKSTLRKARKELEEKGLVVQARGTGRTNTCYHFRFDFARPQNPHEGGERAHPRGATEERSGVLTGDAPGGAGRAGYNQIHVSIHNNVQKESDESEDPGLEFLRQRFGVDAVKRAGAECRLAGLPRSLENLEKILYRDRPGEQLSWSDLQYKLRGSISQSSMDIIGHAFLEERNGLFMFQDSLPDHLKILLERICPRLFFVPESEPVLSRNDFWRDSGAST